MKRGVVALALGGRKKGGGGGGGGGTKERKERENEALMRHSRKLLEDWKEYW